MTTSSHKNYNYLALRGAGVDDMEIVEHHGLDPALAYTPELVPALIEKTRKENYDFYIEEGMTTEDAVKAADDKVQQATRDYKELLAKNGMLK